MLWQAGSEFGYFDRPLFSSIMGEARDITHGKKVIVKNIPERVTRDKLQGYFGSKTKSGGGEMKSFVYPVLDACSRSAVIEFEDESVAQAVIAKVHRPWRNGCLRASAYEPVLFGNTKIYVNQSKFDEITERHKDSEELISDSGIQKLTEGGLTTLEGEWYQIFSVGKTFEQLLSQKEDTSPASNNEDSDGHRQHRVSTVAATLFPNDAEIDSEQEGEQTNSSDQHREDVPTTTDALPNRDETGSGSQTSGIPNTEATDSIRITVDKDILAYIKLTEGEQLENFENRYNITFEAAGKELCAEFHKDADSGIYHFQKFYNSTMERVKQENYTLPSGVNMEKDMRKIEATMQAVREKYRQIHIALLEEYRGVLFIGESARECETAISDFRSMFEGTRPTSIQTQWPGAAASYSSSEELFRHQFPDTGLILTIARGDIAAQNADAIVNAANAGLRDGAGVTGAIYRAGGDEFRRRCGDLMYARWDKDLDIGEVVHNEACGRLQCKFVLHVTGPMWRDIPWQKRRSDCQRTMDGLCWNLITHANDIVKVSSLATPAIGTGIYGVPLSVFCEAMMKSVQKYQRLTIERRMSAIVREIRLVNYDPREAKEIVRHTKRMFEARLSESSV